jgi:hypothetical protein
MASAELHYSMSSLGAGARNSVATRAGWLRTAILVTPVVSVTLLSKFGVPPFAAQGIGISLALIFVAILMGLLNGCVRVDASRLSLYALAIGVLGAIQILQPEPFSVASLLLLAVLSFPYVIAFTRRDDGNRVVEFFLKLTTFIACCGIAQYFLQYVIGSKWIFPLDDYVPTALLVDGFHGKALMSGNIFRATGVFMLEPSFFSQLLAVAIIVELCTFNNLMRLGTFALAMIVSYSGTGMLVLAVCIPILVVTRRRWDLLLIGVAALVMVIPFWDYLHLDHLLNRLNEFESTGTSASQRFTGGLYIWEHFLWDNPWRTLFGMGTGSYLIAISTAHYPVADMALFKLVFEFGLIGTLLYWIFLFYCFAHSPAPGLVKIAIGVTYFLNGIYVPFAHGLALSLLVWSAIPPQVNSAANETASQRRAARNFAPPEN